LVFYSSCSLILQACPGIRGFRFQAGACFVTAMSRPGQLGGPLMPLYPRSSQFNLAIQPNLAPLSAMRGWLMRKCVPVGDCLP